jgi:hypothetical protein
VREDVVQENARLLKRFRVELGTNVACTFTTTSDRFVSRRAISESAALRCGDYSLHLLGRTRNLDRLAEWSTVAFPALAVTLLLARDQSRWRNP